MEENLTGIFANEKFKIGMIEFYSRQKYSKKISYIGKCECGNIVTRHKQYINTCIKNNRIMNCGCKNASLKSGKQHPGWRGVGELSYKRFKSIKRGCSSRARNIKLEITIEQIWDLFLKQNRKCALTGRELTMIDSNSQKIRSTASLDRIDSSGDYTIDNVWWIHKNINLMKMNLSLDQILNIAKLVSENN